MKDITCIFYLGMEVLLYFLILENKFNIQYSNRLNTIF